MAKPIKIRITGDIKDLQKDLGNVEGSLRSFGGKAKAAFGLVGGGIAADKLFDLGSWSLEEGTKLETFGKKARTVFGSNAGEIEEWADDVNESLGLSDEQLVGMAASLGDLLVPMGATRDQAADMSKETVELAGALSAWSGGTIDTADASEILTKAYLGERDALTSLGVKISQAEVDELALAKAKEQGREEVTEMDRALATQELIFRKTTDAQTAWTDGTLDGVKKQNEMKAKVADLKAEIATRLLPVVQRLVTWLVDDVVPAFESVAAWVREHWPQIRQTIVDNVTKIKEKITPIIDGIREFWRLFGEDIRSLIEGELRTIKETFENAFRVIEGIFQTFKGIFTGDWSLAWEGIKNIFGGVVDQIVTTFTGLKDRLKAAASMAMTAVRETLGAAVTGAKNAAASVGRGIVDGLVGAISGAADFAGDIASGIGSAVKGWINRNVIDRINSALEFKIPVKFAPDIHVNPPDIPHLALGGPVRRMAVVGERGPELVDFGAGVGGQPRVINHREAAGSLGGDGIHVHFDGPPPATPMAIGAAVVWKLRTAGHI